MDDFNFIDFCNDIHVWACHNGFWADEATGLHKSPRTADPRINAYANDLSKLMLTTSELGEAAECLRKCYNGDVNYISDPHIPEYANAEVEIADAIIRLLDYGTARFGADRLKQVLQAKHNYNLSRPYKNGKTC
jgi:hypothetical protein